MKWFDKLAAQGDDQAQVSLGVCYYNGLGVSQDYIEAAKWFCKSATQGNARAQFNLGLCYYYGRGVEKKRKEAEKWFRLAAEQGDERAKKNLSIMNGNSSSDGSFLEDVGENVLSNLLGGLL